MNRAMAGHDKLIECLVARQRGEADNRFAVFARASDAVVAAYVLQLALAHRDSALLDAPLRVRISVHTGEAELGHGEYYGPLSTTVHVWVRSRMAARCW
jgi:class 3 adenylate cyclase